MTEEHINTSELRAHINRVEDFLEKAPRRRKFARIERVQIAVALAILTGYLSLNAANIISFPNELRQGIKLLDFELISLVQAIFAGMFLFVKTLTMTVRPIWDPSPIKWIDTVALTAIYIPLLICSSGAVLGVITYPQVQIPWGTAIYITIEAVLLLTVGCWYAQRYKTTMEELFTRTPDELVTATRGPRQEVTGFYFENTTEEPIKEGDLKFKVIPPKEISVELGQCYPEKGSENIWIYASDLDVGDERRIPVHLDATNRDGKLKRDSMEISTIIGGESVNTDIIEIYT